MKKEILIIGGGASGMVAAIVAARNGAKVTLVEQKNELGKKLLATGNGRCNFTNLTMNADCFYSQNPENHFISSLLDDYTPEVIIEFFESIGILAKDRNGYVYPITDQASSIRDALVSELQALHITIYLNTAVTGLKEISTGYSVSMEEQGENSKIFQKNYHSLILATGGMSGLHKQTKYHGYTLLEDTKHRTTKLSPALVPLIGQGKFYKKIAGIRTDARVTAVINGEVVASEIGELQLTDYGLSGIPIFQVSRLITQKLNKENIVAIEIDFMPNFTQESLEELLIFRQKQFPDRTMKFILNGLVKDKLATFFLYTARMSEEDLSTNVELEELRKLARIMKTFTVKIEGSKTFQQAQVTAGGVPISEVNENLESKFHENLYFTGEVLDIDGICGGYNLHFAWATGMLAGDRCSK